MSDYIVRKTMREYITLAIGECTSSIVSPAVEAESFELSVSLIHLVSQNQLRRLFSEDSNLHIGSFLQLCETLKHR